MGLVELFVEWALRFKLASGRCKVGAEMYIPTRLLVVILWVMYLLGTSLPIFVLLL